jgi:non-specific protein-tyrosine kinase
MEIIALAQALLRRWWLLAICAAIGLVAAFIWSSATPRRYESTVTLQLNPSARSALLPYTAEGSGPNAVAGLAASYSEVLRSRTFGEIVVRELGLPVAPEAISGAISSRLTTGTNIFRLSFNWDRAEETQQLAQAVAEIFITENLRRQSAPGGSQRLSEMEDTARRYQSRLDVMRRQRDEADQAISRGNVSRLSELESLDTRLTALETSYTSLLVEISRLRSGVDTASILDNAGAARAVGATSRPQALLFGLLGGLAVAVALAVFLNSLDDTLRTPQDVITHLGSAPLAVIGRIRTDKWDELLRGSRLVTLVAPRSGPAEAFRTLRANLRFAATEQPFRTLVVTSPSAHEGKTLVACNLAIAYAQAGERVLLIDADLRRPGVHNIFGIARQPGLVDALLDGTGLHKTAPGGEPALAVASGSSAPGASAVAQPSAAAIAGITRSSVDNLYILPAGAGLGDPSWLFGSHAVGHLIERLGSDWDLIVFDTAPVGPVADSLLLAAQVDATILVARAGETRPGALNAALESLRPAGRPVLGVVLNDLRPNLLDRYGSYGYHRYYYGYGQHAYGESDGKGNTNSNGRTHAGSPAVAAAPSPTSNGHAAERPG